MTNDDTIQRAIETGDDEAMKEAYEHIRSLHDKKTQTEDLGLNGAQSFTEDQISRLQKRLEVDADRLSQSMVDDDKRERAARLRQAAEGVSTNPIVLRQSARSEADRRGLPESPALNSRLSDQDQGHRGLPSSSQAEGSTSRLSGDEKREKQRMFEKNAREAEDAGLNAAAQHYRRQIDKLENGEQ